MNDYLPLFTQNIIDPKDHSLLTRFYLMFDQRLIMVGFSCGMLGVVIFFIISGFVIAFSLEKTRPGLFLVNRLFRIYPPLLAALLVTAVTSYFYCLHYNVVWPRHWPDLLGSATLLTGVLRQLPISPIAWSLIVEMEFYLIMAGLFFCRGRVTWWAVIALAGANLLTVQAIGFVPRSLAPLVGHLAYNAIFLNYLLLGICLYKIWRAQRVTVAALAVVAAVLGAIEIGFLRFGQLNQPIGEFGWKTGAVCLAIVAFGIYWEPRLKPVRLLKFFGDISYPLYLVHIPLGWMLLHELMQAGAGVTLSLAITAASIIALAYGLHRVVEKPGQALGRRLTKQFSAARTA